jgi:hypothetical protein
MLPDADARSLFGINVCHEAEKARADARPQTLKKPEAYSLEYVEDFSGSRTRQMPVHYTPQ